MEVPQFPLGSVLFPTMALPLRIFETRYKKMLADVLDGDGRFGVVLIERGSEAGGGDVRTSTGVLARVLDVRQNGDNLAVLAVGTERYRVRSWLPDDPYPLAAIELWPDRPTTDSPEMAARLADYYTRVTALRGAAETPGLANDPATATMQLSALLPVGSFDRFGLLSCVGPEDRLELLESLLTEAEELTRLLGDGCAWIEANCLLVGCKVLAAHRSRLGAETAPARRP